MWDAVLALGAVDAFCVRSAGCVVAEGESEVSRRAYWRAPRRERKRSHSTPPSRDYGGVERRQCRGAQQLARRSSLKSMSAQSAESTCCGVSGGSSDSSASAPARAGEAGDIAVISDASASRQAAADRGPRTKRTTDHGPETNSASQQKDPFLTSRELRERIHSQVKSITKIKSIVSSPILPAGKGLSVVSRCDLTKLVQHNAQFRTLKPRAGAKLARRGASHKKTSIVEH